MTSIEILERAEDYVGIHYINGVEEPYINPCLLAAIKDGVAAICAKQQAEKLNPPCYQPDGDGCAYQTYGDNNDEPIDRCKECPLCYSDKTRHQSSNDPMTLEELREMDGEPVWLVGVSSVNNFKGSWDICDWENGEVITFPYCMESPDLRNYGITWLAYRHKPEEITK